MKCVFLDRKPLDNDDMDFSDLFKLVDELVFFDNTNTGDVKDRVRDAEIVVVNKVRLDRDIIRAANKLKLIVVSATGVDNVDTECATTCGITVTNCRNYATPSVVQHTIGLMLALNTNLIAYQRVARTRAWSRAGQFSVLSFPIQEVRGRVLGVVGYGYIGRAVASVAKALGMNILVAGGNRHARDVPGAVPLTEVLQQSDVVSLHCPLTNETRHLIDRNRMGDMKRGAVLINTARGGLVDIRALCDALVDGSLGGAGIDVLEREPPGEQCEILDLSIPNLILTPHCAWGSLQSRQRAVTQVTENIRGFQKGKPIRVVNR